MIFPSPEMNESEQGSLYQRIHRNINDLVNQSNQEGLESVTVFKDDNYIKTEYFLNSKGKEYLKVSTTKIEAILPIHSYNSDFIQISDEILNNNIKGCNKVHKYNTRNKTDYVHDPISLTFKEPILEWSDSDEWRWTMGSVIQKVSNIIEHLYGDCDHILESDYPRIVAKMTDNNEMMIYGEALSLLYAIKHYVIHNIMDNIISTFSDVNTDMSSPPPPVRFTNKEFKEILPIINAKKEHTIHTCAICMEDIKVRSRICMTKCGHCFHSRCLRTWLVSKCQTPQCPCCRESLIDESLCVES